MKEIVDRDDLTKREVWKRDDAIKHFKKIGEHYKAEIIKDIPEAEELSIYDFIIGSQLVGLKSNKHRDEFDKALRWFSKNNIKAYMALLD